jgi:hypothetical protein
MWQHWPGANDIKLFCPNTLAYYGTELITIRKVDTSPFRKTSKSFVRGIFLVLVLRLQGM